MQIDLKRMNFGAPAAERDIALGLTDYFVESDAFKRLADRSRTIVLGNRGTGKSAIFKILADRARKSGAHVLELNPDHYSYEMLSSVLRAESEGSWAKHGAFTSSWKYLILILVMQELTRSGPRLKTGSAAKVYSFLRDHVEGEQENPIAVLISYLKRIEGFKIGPAEASLKTSELAKLYRLQELEPLIPCIKELLDKRSLVVLVDELDKGWDNSEDAKAFVSGLFQAAIWLNELSTRLTVYISLRQELYDSIPALYDDTQKYRDLIETIRWDEPSLLAVAGMRIKHSFPELKASGNDEAWGSIFAETLRYRKAKSFNYLVDRTLYRPRELIQFCSDAVADARSQNLVPIDYGVVSRVELDYSAARQKDISSEYRFQYPGLESIFEVFRGKVYLFERSDLEMLCLQICTGELRTDKFATWVLEQDPDFLIDVLWQVGFLRARAIGGLKALRRSGSSYVGPHQVSTLNLRTVSHFQVHPMFRAALGMREPKRDASQSHDDDGNDDESDA
ncbi:MAG: hypothetical protein M9951_11425 [Burkholderiaceae bacterium]|jgi:hypothetical protein|nr:hypothetical protein [Burkholderiaceae bacterium]